MSTCRNGAQLLELGKALVEEYKATVAKMSQWSPAFRAGKRRRGKSTLKSAWGSQWSPAFRAGKSAYLDVVVRQVTIVAMEPSF